MRVLCMGSAIVDAECVKMALRDIQEGQLERE